MKASPLSGCIEPLESRIAPAALVGTKSVTYTDTDGDTISITVTKGDLTGRVLFSTAFGTTGPQQLEQINLTGAQFSGTDLSVTITSGAPNSDSLIHFGFLNAKGVDLGDVSIQGDVSKILAGDTKTNTVALNKLNLRNLGNSTNVGTPDGISIINGPLGDVALTGSILQTQLSVTGGAAGTIRSFSVVDIIGGATPLSGSVSATGSVGAFSFSEMKGGAGLNSGALIVGGSLPGVTGTNVYGSSGKSSGSILVKGSAGPISINTGGVFRGGSGVDSGSIQVLGSADDISVGALQGSSGFQSGRIFVKGAAADILVNQLVGDSGDFSGSITGGSTISSVTVQGDVTGKTGADSGRIRAAGLIGSVSVGGNLIGGSKDYSGAIRADLGLGSVTIGGNVTSGLGIGSGSIVSNLELGPVNISGSVTGTEGRPVIISALGKSKLAAGIVTNISITSVNVTGAATFLNLLGGYDVLGKGLNADAQLGNITLGSARGVNVVAGALAGADGKFGTADDRVIAGGSASVISRIGSLIVTGQTSSTVATTDGFGVVAQQVDTVSINGAAVTLTPGPSNDKGIPLGAADDFKVFEI